MIAADPLHVAAAQAGDERAFRALVEPYRRALEVHCYRMLGSVHDAEDVSQDTLLRAWRSLERFERRSSIETWLYRIATNACLDELERRPRRAEPVEVEPYPDERLADAVTSIADPAARYAQREGMELAFLTAIQRLPGRQRAVLILRDVLGWTGIEAEAPARAVTPGRRTQRELLRRYVDAWERADMAALLELLREDAVMTMPPEGAAYGREAIVEIFTHGCVGRLNLSAEATWVNGTPAVQLYEPSGARHRIMVLELDGDRISHVGAYVVP